MTGASVREINRSDRNALKNYVALERGFYGSNPLFVSEIDADVIKCLSGQSCFFGDMEHALFVASRGDEDMAKGVAMINRRYQKAKNEAVGFIGYFAAALDSKTQTQALLEHAEAWLRERGVTRIIAPYNGAAFLGAGLLTADFDRSPFFPVRWNPPHYGEYLMDSGYEPTYPFWFYTVDFQSDKYRAMKERASKNSVAMARPLDKKRWDREMELITTLLNESFSEEWEFHPYSAEEVHEFFDPMKPVLDPRQFLIGEVDGKPAGWCLGMPDWTPLFRSFKGKMGLFQIIRFLFGAGRYQRAGLLGIGVLPEYKGTGLAHTLAATLYRRYEERGLKEALYYPVNESNLRSRRFAESMGGSGRIFGHCYDKRLTG